MGGGPNETPVPTGGAEISILFEPREGELRDKNGCCGISLSRAVSSLLQGLSGLLACSQSGFIIATSHARLASPD